MLRSLLLTLFLTSGITAHAFELPHILEGHVFEGGHAVFPSAALSSRSDMNMEAVLETISEKENSTLPKMVNDSIRLDKVAALPGKHFIRQYTLIDGVSAEKDKVLFHHAMLPTLKSQMCADKSLAMFFKHGISVTQSYKNQDGQDIGNIQVAPNDCMRAAS